MNAGPRSRWRGGSPVNGTWGDARKLRARGMWGEEATKRIACEGKCARIIHERGKLQYSVLVLPSPDALESKRSGSAAIIRSLRDWIERGWMARFPWVETHGYHQGVATRPEEVDVEGDGWPKGRGTRSVRIVPTRSVETRERNLTAEREEYVGVAVPP